MAGYSSRQSTFTTGDTILAAHSNDEFNQLLASFNATTGHTHDGTAGEGGPITSIRDANTLNKVLVDSTNNHLEFYVNVSSSSVQQLRIQDGAIVPITDNDIDLGTSSLEFKDAFFDGTVEADAITIGGTNVTSLFASLSGANTFTGNIEIDVASGDPTIILDTQGADKFHIAASTALAGEQLGLKFTYLDAGSGALHPVSMKMISSVRKEISCPIIVGGGIKSYEQLENAWLSGADIVVVGNAIEKNSALIEQLDSRIKCN